MEPPQLPRQKENARRFSVWQAMPRAFFSRELYWDVAYRWQGIALAYIVVVVTVCWAVSSYLFYNQVDSFLVSSGLDRAEQYPVMTIEKGELSIDVPSPYILQDLGTGQDLVIFDTREVPVDLEQSDALMLVGRSQIFIKSNDQVAPVLSFPPVFDGQYDHTRVRSWIGMTRAVSGWFYFFLLGPFQLAFRLFQALVFAMIGRVFLQWHRVMLPFKDLLRLAVVASSPCIIVETVVAFARLSSQYVDILYVAASLAYLYLAVESAKTEV